MKNKINFYLISFLICSFFSNLKSQNLDTTLFKARNSFELGFFEETDELYNRISFFDENKLNSKDYLNWAFCKQNDGDAENVKLFMIKAINTSESSLMKYKISENLAIYQLSKMQFEEALITLSNVNYLNEAQTYKNEYSKLMALSYFGLKNYEKSKEILLENFPNKTENIDRIFNRIVYLQKRYKPKKAKTLNLICPGLGFYYAGNFWKGLNSTLLMAALGYSGLKYIQNLGFINASLGLGATVQRYHTGGAENAEKQTIKRLEYETNLLAKQIIEL